MLMIIMLMRLTPVLQTLLAAIPRPAPSRHLIVRQ
jgi:hypothetical protein